MACALMYSWNKLYSYELNITKDFGLIKLHGLQLGEYFSPVQELRIIDSQSDSVVLFKVKAENSATHTVTVRAGENGFDAL